MEMQDKPVFFGAVAAALAASLCCILPLTAGILGASAVAVGLAFEQFRLWFGLGALGLLAVGFVAAYRGKAKACCAVEGGKAKAPVRKKMLWAFAIIVALLLTFPYYVGFIF